MDACVSGRFVASLELILSGPKCDDSEFFWLSLAMTRVFLVFRLRLAQDRLVVIWKCAVKCRVCWKVRARVTVFNRRARVVRFTDSSVIT